MGVKVKINDKSSQGLTSVNDRSRWIVCSGLKV